MLLSQVVESMTRTHSKENVWAAQKVVCLVCTHDSTEQTDSILTALSLTQFSSFDI